MSEIHYYRVHRTNPLTRTWQAEWDLCPWCPRAFTRWGIERKAARWESGSLEQQIIRARRRTWIRAHITQRSDEFYASTRGRK